MTKTIEHLTARVRELEEENARLKSLATTKGAMGLLADQLKQLAASQAYAEQLRKLLAQIGLDAGRSESDLDKFQQYVEIDRAYVKKIRKALALHHDTSALDTYVAGKVKEAMK